MTDQVEFDAEMAALRAILDALLALDDEAQARIVRYLTSRWLDPQSGRQEANDG